MKSKNDPLCSSHDSQSPGLSVSIMTLDLGVSAAHV